MRTETVIRDCTARTSNCSLLASLLLTILLLNGVHAVAQNNSRKVESPAAAQLRSLNNSLLQFHGHMQRATSTQAAALRSQAATVISQRASALSKLIASDTRAALTFAFSPQLLVDLAGRFPNSASQLEQHGSWQGPIEYWIADTADLKQHWTQILMTIGPRKYELHFAGPEPAYVSTGQMVRVNGVALGGRIAVETSSPAQSGTAATSGSTVGTTPATLLSAQSIPPAGYWPVLALLLWMSIFKVPGFLTFAKRVFVGLRQSSVYGVVFALLISSSHAALGQTSTQACSTTGVQNMAVLLVTFPGVTPPATVTPQSMHDIFFSTTGHSLDGYWREASYGRTSATGDVFGW